MKDEFNALISNKTWTLVPRPPDANVINCTWLFKQKHNVDVSLARTRRGMWQMVVANNLEFTTIILLARLLNWLSFVSSLAWPFLIIGRFISWM